MLGNSNVTANWSDGGSTHVNSAGIRTHGPIDSSFHNSSDYQDQQQNSSSTQQSIAPTATTTTTIRSALSWDAPLSDSVPSFTSGASWDKPGNIPSLSVKGVGWENTTTSQNNTLPAGPTTTTTTTTGNIQRWDSKQIQGWDSSKSSPGGWGYNSILSSSGMSSGNVSNSTLSSTGKTSSWSGSASNVGVVNDTQSNNSSIPGWGTAPRTVGNTGVGWMPSKATRSIGWNISNIKEQHTFDSTNSWDSNTPQQRQSNHTAWDSSLSSGSSIARPLSSTSWDNPSHIHNNNNNNSNNNNNINQWNSSSSSTSSSAISTRPQWKTSSATPGIGMGSSNNINNNHNNNNNNNNANNVNNINANNNIATSISSQGWGNSNSNNINIKGSSNNNMMRPQYSTWNQTSSQQISSNPNWANPVNAYNSNTNISNLSGNFIDKSTSSWNNSTSTFVGWDTKSNAGGAGMPPLGGWNQSASDLPTPPGLGARNQIKPEQWSSSASVSMNSRQPWNIPPRNSSTVSSPSPSSLPSPSWEQASLSTPLSSTSNSTNWGQTRNRSSDNWPTWDNPNRDIVNFNSSINLTSRVLKPHAWETASLPSNTSSLTTQSRDNIAVTEPWKTLNKRLSKPNLLETAYSQESSTALPHAISSSIHQLDVDQALNSVSKDNAATSMIKSMDTLSLRPSPSTNNPDLADGKRDTISLQMSSHDSLKPISSSIIKPNDTFFEPDTKEREQKVISIGFIIM